MENFLCIKCRENCAENTILCTGCDNWIHMQCVPMSPQMLRSWTQKETQFLCRNCCFLHDSFDVEKSWNRLVSYKASTVSEQKLHVTDQSTSSLSFIDDYAPCFGIQGKNVKILKEPAHFHESLKLNFKEAKQRIVIASLYLGTGDLEHELVNSIKCACETAKKSGNDKFEVHILLDYNRGSRGGDVSSRSMLTPLLQQYDGMVSVHLYHTPDLRGYLKQYLPAKLDETVGVQHMKVYLFDNSFIISGANLSDNYFTNRQDRYVLFQNCSELSDFFAGLVKTVSSLSFSLSSDNTTSLHHSCQVHPYEGNKMEYKKLASDRVTEYIQSASKKNVPKYKSKRTSSCETTDTSNGKSDIDTFVYPLPQMALFGIRTEETFVNQMLQTAGEAVNIFLATGYFNLTKQYQNTLVMDSMANCDLLIASPQVNGFFGAKGVMGNIPDAYTHIASSFYRTVSYYDMQNRIRLHEYYRDQWTYHVKGLWYYLPGHTLPCMTLMGSSNFGYRSVNRDLECQIAVVTENKQLQQELHQEKEEFFSRGREAHEETYQTSDRFVPYWVRLTSPFLRRFL